jgi:flagellar biosynthetic protein FlhB
MADEDLDKSHEASPYKLARARERGQVARSAEFVSAAVLLVGALAIYSNAGAMLLRMFAFGGRLWRNAGQYGGAPVGFDAVWGLLSQSLSASASWLAPFLVALATVAVVANVVQVGALTSFQPIKPDWSRLNPVTGFKRVFSMQALYFAGLSIVKLAVLAAVGYWAVTSEFPGFVRLSAIAPGEYMALLLRSIGSIAIKVGATLLLLALFDVWYMRFSFGRRMRMSRREMKEEHKQREGDPRIRRRLRELRMEAYKRSMSSRGMPKADVLVVNPTRVAIGLQYEHGAMASPRVVAKGVGAVARKMRAYASSRGIPIVENRKLARALLRRVDVDASIPEDLFADVARIIVWVMAMRRRTERMAARTASGGKSLESSH